MTPPIAVRFIADGDILQKIDLKVANAFHYSFEGGSAHLQQILSDWIHSYLSGIPNEIPKWTLKQTSFQEKITKELLSVPFGSTLSYQELAEKVGMPKAARAVGNACGRNPFPLMIPCHRIVRKNGTLGGFAFDLEIKKQLLLFEHNCIF